MSEAAPVILLGLDAFDPVLAREWADAGELPALARLFETGTGCPVRNPVGLYVGALWASFATGLRPDRHGYHCWDEIEPSTYRHRLVSPDLGGHPKFWDSVADQGGRVAVVDVPHMRVEGSSEGVRIFEWGCHDRHFGLDVWPPERAARLQPHPILSVDPHRARDFAPDDFEHRAGPVRTAGEESELLAGLVSGAAMKSRLLESLYREEPWDLFVAVYGESHAVGHQLWHLHDEGHPRFSSERCDRIGGDPLLQVYREIDSGIGAMLDLAGEDATVLVLLSHGMGPHYDGTHLLDEVLGRLDRVYRGEAGDAEWPRAMLPRGRALADRINLPTLLRRPLAAMADRRGAAPARARQLFFAEPNNNVYAGIRLNLVGREPKGCVAKDDAASLMDRLAHDLLALVNADTGEAAVQRVVRSDLHYRRRQDDSLPDLFVQWARSAPIEAVTSPAIGLVSRPYTGWRTGDHLDHGLLLAAGPGLAPGGKLDAIELEDIAPSLTARFGAEPLALDGRAVPWLAAATPVEPA